MDSSSLTGIESGENRIKPMQGEILYYKFMYLGLFRKLLYTDTEDSITRYSDT